MKKNHAKVLHFDLYGKRENKYNFLLDNNIKSINWKELNPNEPYFFFIPKNYSVEISYNNGIEIGKLFKLISSGITTSNDDLLSDFTKEQLVQKLINNNINDVVKTDYYKVAYKPFDIKIFCLNPKYSMRSREVLIRNYKNNNLNYSLNFRKTAENTNLWQHIFVSNYPIEGNYLSARSFCIPLYIYPDGSGQQNIGQTAERTPNLNMEIVGHIAERLGLAFVAEKINSPSTEGVAALADGVVSYSSFSPIDILDYIYAVLHSPTYREKYKEFLKIDFPRVPYPKDAVTFWELVKLGSEIRQIHLLESPIVEKYITQYPIDGNNVVTKPKYQDGKVYINDTQYFCNVPQIAWEFYIGGYQPAQKWLKDRKDRKLEFDDILHYQKIIVALAETDRLMKEIDKIEIE